MADLDAILSSKDMKVQIESLKQYVDNQLIPSGKLDLLKAFVSKVLADDVPQQVSRSIVLHFGAAIATLPPNVFEDIANFTVQSIRQSSSANDEADYVLRDLLFKYYTKEEEYKSAAMILAGLNLDSTSKSYTIDEKANIIVTIAETFLTDDESSADQAETMVHKASLLMNDVSSSTMGRVIHLRYKSIHARVLDANRKFVDAAMRYFELSITPRETVDMLNLNQGDLLEFLGKAVTCAVLGKAGPQRSRVLGVLFKDERLRQLDYLPRYSSHASVLIKMYTEQLLRRDELATFEESLADHQKAQTADGFTFPEKAVIEHNMVATGNLYDNIHFSELGTILRLDANTAERVAASMISEDRLKATIDQTESILIFENDDDALLSWDDRIREVCNELTATVEFITAN